MSDEQTPQIPLDLKQQMAPGGQFPGTAETLATPVGSDQPVRVKIGQKPNKHLQLSKEEFRKRAAAQKELDAQRRPGEDPTPPPPTPNPAPKRHSPGRPKGTKSGPRRGPAVPPDQPIGRLYPVTSPIEAPTPQPIQIPTDAMLEQRMERLERGMDMIIRALAVRDAQREEVPPEFTPGEEALLDPEDFDEDEEDYSDIDEELEPAETFDAPPLRVEVKKADDVDLDEQQLQRLQQMIVKRNPMRLFRQYWHQLSRAAQYNEWSAERREAFNQAFNSTVVHPKFIYLMSKFLRGSRSGHCIGNEQIARVCGMMAGFLSIYQLASQGR